LPPEGGRRIILLYLGKRALSLAPTLLFVSLITFGLMRFVPGDPIDTLYGMNRPDPAVRAALMQKLGLDQPVWVQYGRWLGRVAAGDFGYSIRAAMPVGTLIEQRLPASALLVGAAVALAVVTAIPLGILAAARRDSVYDFGAMITALVTLSVPPFVSGVLLVLLFGLTLHWLPTMGFPRAHEGLLAWPAHLALPAVALAGTLAGIVVRLTRSSVLDELGQDYVRIARAKGLAERTVLVGHVLKNALLPVVTLVGLQMSYLLGGTVVVEIVFAWPGIGGLAVDAILARDYPVVQGLVLLVACAVVLISLAVDLSYSLLDPRIRLG
jgi:peptide/nickel transport system permease protein